MPFPSDVCGALLKNFDAIVDGQLLKIWGDGHVVTAFIYIRAMQRKLEKASKYQYHLSPRIT